MSVVTHFATVNPATATNWSGPQSDCEGHLRLPNEARRQLAGHSATPMTPL